MNKKSLEQEVAEISRYKTRKLKKNLQYQYTSKEIHDMGVELARKHNEQTEAEQRMKSAAQQMKDAVERVKLDISVLSRKVSNGFEYRDIECEEKKDFLDCKFTVARLDTGEVVEERALRDEERQREMDLDEAAASESKTDVKTEEQRNAEDEEGED